MKFFNFKKGYSLIEILLVVAIAAALFLFAAPAGIKLFRSQLVDEARSNIIDTLQLARHNAVLQKNDSEFGVHIVSGRYTLFQGESYDLKDDDFDLVFTLLDSIVPSGELEIVFSKLTGLPSVSGTTTLTLNNIEKSLYINEAGTIIKVP